MHCALLASTTPASGAASLLAATASRAFCESAKFAHAEDVFLAALLQDIGVLALDRVTRDFYSKLPQPSSHAHWIAYETEILGRDHAAYTAMLLKTWNLPERICKAVEGSHAPQTFSSSTDEGRFARCVALGSDLAEAVLTPERGAAVGALAQRAHGLLGMSHEQFNDVVARVLRLIPETEELYETSIIEVEAAENSAGRGPRTTRRAQPARTAGSKHSAGNHERSACAHGRSRGFEPARSSDRRAEPTLARSNA